MGEKIRIDNIKRIKDKWQREIPVDNQDLIVGIKNPDGGDFTIYSSEYYVSSKRGGETEILLGYNSLEEIFQKVYKIVHENSDAKRIFLKNEWSPSFGKTREERLMIYKICDYFEFCNNQIKGINSLNLLPLEEVRYSEVNFEDLPDGNFPVGLKLGMGNLVRYLYTEGDKRVFVQELTKSGNPVRSFSPSHLFYRTPLLLSQKTEK